MTSDTEVPYVREQYLDLGAAHSATSYDDIAEPRFRPELNMAWLTDLTVQVPLPDQITSHPHLLADFVNHRVLARASVREDHTLLHGSHDGIITGLLDVAEHRPLRNNLGNKRGKHDIDTLLTLTAEIEETGGTCDGIVVHPDLYWKLAQWGLLGALDQANVRVCRTRMIPRTQALLGGFHTGVNNIRSGHRLAHTTAPTRRHQHSGRHSRNPQPNRIRHPPTTALHPHPAVPRHVVTGSRAEANSTVPKRVCPRAVSPGPFTWSPGWRPLV